MSLIDEILTKVGLKYDELNTVEKETLNTMLDAVNTAILTPDKLRDYVRSMRDAVERELIDEPEFHRIFLFRVDNRKQILLKARLRNYLLLESFLDSPKKAKDAVDKALGNIKKR